MAEGDEETAGQNEAAKVACIIDGTCSEAWEIMLVLVRE